jgi:hypothetical protein
VLTRKRSAILARYCARHPVALSRLTYQPAAGRVTYHSDKTSGPTAGAETLDVLDFLARVVSHIPNKGQVLQRYYGWYANRTRGRRRQAGAQERAPLLAAADVVPPPAGRRAPPLRTRGRAIEIPRLRSSAHGGARL